MGEFSDQIVSSLCDYYESLEAPEDHIILYDLHSGHKRMYIPTKMKLEPCRICLEIPKLMISLNQTNFIVYIVCTNTFCNRGTLSEIFTGYLHHKDSLITVCEILILRSTYWKDDDGNG